MAEEFQRLRQYEYKANANLVLQADKESRRTEDGSGAVESLFGKLDNIRMGDRLRPGSIPVIGGSNLKLKRDREDNEESSSNKRSNTSNVFGLNKNTSVLAEAEDVGAIIYRPKTKETRVAYEELLSLVVSFIGDQPHDVLRSAADEILAVLKDDHFKDSERQRETEKILSKMSSERFHQFVAVGKKISDFSVSDAAAEEAGDDLNDEHGVAVVFDDEDDEDELGGFRDGYDRTIGIGGDDEEEDEDNEDEGDEAVGKGVLRGANTAQEGEEVQSKLDVHEIDSHWLQRQLSPYFSDHNISSKMAEETLEALKIADERMCENQLVMLLDFDKFDLIKLLLKNRTEIFFATRFKQAQSDADRAAVEEEIRIYDEATGSNDASQVLERLLSKSSAETWVKDRMGEFSTKARKEARALTSADEVKSNTLDDDEDVMRYSRKIDSKVQNTETNIDLSSLEFQQGAHLMANKRCELPDKSWRATKKGYEEVHVPAIRPIIPPGEKLTQIKDLPAWMHPAFNGIASLNRIQSRMVNSALFSSDNVLLCAPTGAGKTNVALMCMLNIIARYRNEADGTIDLSAFKIVYIAPMKALVQEVVQSFSKRLAPFNMIVRELSGDQNLSRQQIVETQVIVTTPEKWDIITRKAGDRTYTQLVKLMIIDEIHLLHDERGPVLEALVARTVRHVESTQEMVRMMGLSATLPNYEDVAAFLRVDPAKGLFFFDNSFRPVPLQQQYIGVTEKKALKRFQVMNEICYEKVLQHAGRNQVLIFVHSRAETVKTAMALRDMVIENDVGGQFVRDDSASKEILREESEVSAKNQYLKELLPYGFAVHHAGLVRSDRTLVEDLFADKHVQVLVSTATLAWGVNLPAHTVIIKGTQMYSPEQGRWVELSPMDILQMMGRAGRYGLDSEGEGIIITAHSELQYYLSLMNQQLPIESQMIKRLPDVLNAEIVLGSVQTVREAAIWLSYTYFYVRMLRNPSLYGVSADDIAQADDTLYQRRRDIVHSAANILDKRGLIKYDRKTGSFHVTVMGRVASHYYVSHESVGVYNENLKPTMSDIEIFRLFSLSGEFKNIHVREEEKLELAKLIPRVPIPIKESVDEPSAKVNVLLQAYISRLKLDGFALLSDMTYIQQSACRLMRSLFDVALKKGWSSLSTKMLNICKMVERKIWGSQSPLRQFQTIPDVITRKLEKNSDITWDLYYDLKPQDFGEMVKIPKMGKTLHKYVHMFPKLLLDVSVVPITRSLIKFDLSITPDFQFDTSVHEPAMLFWIIVDDCDSQSILYSEPFILRAAYATVEHSVSFMVPMFEPQPPQYFVRMVSDRWLHSEVTVPVSFRHFTLPEKFPPATEVLDLQPLPVAAISRGGKANGVCGLADKLYSDSSACRDHSINVKLFNSIQTQVFHSIFEGNENVLLAAPTGSGKTVCAEFALLRLFSHAASAKAVYLHPKVDVVQKLFSYFSVRFGSVLGLKVGLLTGDSALDLKALEANNLIIASTHHWDMISRRWRQRKNVQAVDVMIADDIHLLGEPEGSEYEVVLARCRHMSSELKKSIRIIALSSAIANAKDVAEWLGVSNANSFNFLPAARPVPLVVHIHGFDTNHIGERMHSMAKPCFDAICNRCVMNIATPDGDFSFAKPSIVFVPSRRQCQLTVIDIISYAVTCENKQMFLNLQNKGSLANLLCLSSDDSSVGCMYIVDDETLYNSLCMGIGFIHFALSANDTNVVLALYKSGVISVIVAPFNLCWSLPSAYMVVLMDTVYYEGKEHRYVDYKVSDLVQMTGLACYQPDAIGAASDIIGYKRIVGGGKKSNLSVVVTCPGPRMNLGQHNSIAIIMCHTPKKEFLRRLMYESLPIESNIPRDIHDHLNAEIVSKTIDNKQHAVDYITWLFLYKRIVKNPNYYGLEGYSHAQVSEYLSELVENTVDDLSKSRCVSVDENEIDISPLNFGMVASYYSISYRTVELFGSSVSEKLKISNILNILSIATEFQNITLRLNEDVQLQRLGNHLPIALSEGCKFDSIATKVNVLLQCYFSRIALPVDLVHDLRSYVLKDIIKLIQALVDVISSEGWLKPALAAMEVSQMITQAMWTKDSVLLQVPHVSAETVETLRARNVNTVYDLMEMDDNDRNSALGMNAGELNDVAIFCNNYPNIELSFSVNGFEVDTLRKNSPLEVSCGEPISVCIQLQREVDESDAGRKEFPIVSAHYPNLVLSGELSSLSNTSVLCTRSEGWWCVVGDNDKNALHTIKRVAIGANSKVNCEFSAPDYPGRYTFTLYLMSDSYFGCDQEFTFELVVSGEMEE